MACSLFSSSYNVSVFVCYSESTNVLVYSTLGILKFRHSDEYYVHISNSFVNIYSVYHTLAFSYKLILSLLSTVLWGTCFGYFSKYRIKGLGHRIYLKNNSFLYKIGYSHLVYKLLDFDIINSPKRFKKEFYFALRGLNLVNLRRSLFIIQSYRIPNCYCFNGIFIHGIIVEKKEGKKGFML